MAEQGIDLSRYLRHGSIVGENGSDDWQTPKVIYEALNKRFNSLVMQQPQNRIAIVLDIGQKKMTLY
ncbi:hypothetical protein LNO23_24460 [Klebsiella pneumoniae subsp. pneumoniae]|nr:hypothetical protein [Klebsiella pneumoniae subsp. pneumoniae]